uniref:PSII 6.1 kDa protein n=1 Tax=Strombidinopsis acuminata TaxID=141414 RepID=A0A7S3WGX4_9SPIT|mmetsp:Transcript_35532/g.47995  ORF Transcript_35532/g.47995 Transcript_35532/m.47995 type:complete len:128 (+) Transcript_35532:84-467(+)
MARSTARVLIAAVAVAALCQLSSLAFVPPAQAQLRGAQVDVDAVRGVALAGAVAMPLPAMAVEQTYDGFAPPELVAIFLPIFFVWFAYLEWEGKQEPTDNVTGAGTLGKSIDGVAGQDYKRRSPEFD